MEEIEVTCRSCATTFVLKDLAPGEHEIPCPKCEYKAVVLGPAVSREMLRSVQTAAEPYDDEDTEDLPTEPSTVESFVMGLGNEIRESLQDGDPPPAPSKEGGSSGRSIGALLVLMALAGLGGVHVYRATMGRHTTVTKSQRVAVVELKPQLSFERSESGDWQAAVPPMLSEHFQGDQAAVYCRYLVRSLDQRGPDTSLTLHNAAGDVVMACRSSDR